MTTKFCRTFNSRNSSSLPSFSISNHSNLIDAESITNSISLIIFVLAFVGNTAALIVMFGSRGPIRLTNNKYLANLACADLLRACFMPFTIIARMKKNFMFGKMICKILPIVQGLSVAVDVFTLVGISIERYLAICRPLLILKLQSIRYANLLNNCILFLIWSSGLLIAMPNVYMYNLCSLPKPGRFKSFYFVIPILFMIVLYTLIIWKMSRNSTAMKMRSFQNSSLNKNRSYSSSGPPSKSSPYRLRNLNSLDSKLQPSLSYEKSVGHSSHRSSIRSGSVFSEDEQNESFQLDINKHQQQINRTRSISHPNYPEQRSANKQISFRKSRHEQNNSSSQSLTRMDRHRRKALKLLIAIIVEFFVCWTPLFIYHTLGTFNKKYYRTIPNVYVNLILLFSFASASCNPLTYYFMSKRYRTALYAYLQCCFNNKNKQRMFKNEKNYQTKRLIKAFHSHQRQTSKDIHHDDIININTNHSSAIFKSKT